MESVCWRALPSGQSQWHHPLLETFRTLFKRCHEEPHLHDFFRELYEKLRPRDKKGWWALRLLTATSEGDPPTPEEVVDMVGRCRLTL
jgi:hypothetical protein